MKRLIGLLLFFPIFAWAIQFAPGHILLSKQQGVPDGALAHELGPIKYIGAGIYQLDVPAGTEERAAQSIAHMPGVKHAHVDEKHLPAFTPDDPAYASSWHFTKIRADVAWDTTMGSGMTVAMLDSGADYNHPDLAPNLLPGWNFFNNNSDVQDKTGHGTATASVTVALTNNALDIASMGGDLKLVPLRITDDSQIGYDTYMVQAINWMVANGIKLGNISYQGVAGNPNIRNAGQYLKDHGGLLITAAGNNDGNPGFTATTTLIAVSATDQNDVITSFSDYGDYVSMSAPGINIPCDQLNGTYAWCYGTSFSGPIVMGTLALMMAANPAIDNLTAEQLLYSTAVDLGAPGKDIYYGYGRVDTAAAVAAAVAYVAPLPPPPPPPPPADTTPPTITSMTPANGSVFTQQGKPTVQISATATDDLGVTQFGLYIDAHSVASATTGSVSYTWNVKKTSKGLHSITAIASDAAGNSTSKTITVTVK